jgi:hypothetical protein
MLKFYPFLGASAVKGIRVVGGAGSADERFELSLADLLQHFALHLKSYVSWQNAHH